MLSWAGQQRDDRLVNTEAKVTDLVRREPQLGQLIGCRQLRVHLDPRLSGADAQGGRVRTVLRLPHSDRRTRQVQPVGAGMDQPLETAQPLDHGGGVLTSLPA